MRRLLACVPHTRSVLRRVALGIICAGCLRDGRRISPRWRGSAHRTALRLRRLPHTYWRTRWLAENGAAGARCGMR